MTRIRASAILTRSFSWRSEIGGLLGDEEMWDAEIVVNRSLSMMTYMWSMSLVVVKTTIWTQAINLKSFFHILTDACT
jgi:hypothetical protein